MTYTMLTIITIILCVVTGFISIKNEISPKITLLIAFIITACTGYFLDMHFVVIVALSITVINLAKTSVTAIVYASNGYFHRYDYSNYLDELESRIEHEGILVKTMSTKDDFLAFEAPGYKRELGAVPIENENGKICSVYVAYEDFDGTVKYYNFPQEV